MELLESLGLMAACFPSQGLLFGVLLIIGAAVISDYTIRKRRGKILRYVDGHGKSVISFNAFSDLSSVSLLRMRFSWEHAELYMTDDSIFYFGCQNLFGFTIYRRCLQLHLSESNALPLVGNERYYVIEKTKMSGAIWEVHFRQASSTSMQTVNKLLLSDLSLDAVEAIEKFNMNINESGVERL